MGIVEVIHKTGQYVPPEIQQMVDSHLARQTSNRERRMAEDEQFAKVLMVAEKPSVAKLLAENLSGGRMRTRRGQSRANQILEFIKFFGPAQRKCKLIVTSVVGHVYGLNFEDGRVRDLSQLFQAKTVKVVEDTTKKLRIVEHLQVWNKCLSRCRTLNPTLHYRSWPRRLSTSPCGSTATGRVRTSGSR